jgi:predicted site-specific integrase-resolvase
MHEFPLLNKRKKEICQVHSLLEKAKAENPTSPVSIIHVLHEQIEEKTAQQELVEDLLAVVTSFSGK